MEPFSAAHCSWALFSAAAVNRSSAGALFGDIRSAYDSAIRQVVVGSEEPDDVLLCVFERLGLAPDTCRAIIDFIHTQSSLLAIGGASPSLTAFLRVLNEETWFVVDGSEVVTQSCRGARPGETIADLIYFVLQGH